MRDALNLTEGCKIKLEGRGQEIPLSNGAAWQKLRGAGRDITKDIAELRK